jgi:hypothetical protein
MVAGRSDPDLARCQRQAGGAEVTDPCCGRDAVAVVRRRRGRRVLRKGCWRPRLASAGSGYCWDRLADRRTPKCSEPQLRLAKERTRAAPSSASTPPSPRKRKPELSSLRPHAFDSANPAPHAERASQAFFVSIETRTPPGYYPPRTKSAFVKSCRRCAPGGLACGRARPTCAPNGLVCLAPVPSCAWT